MKKLMKFQAALILLVISPLMVASFANEQTVVTLHGAITDSQCAYNVHSVNHSHEQMIKNGVPGAMDDRTCTLHCVRDKGGVYVLMVKSEVYRLDDQDQAEQLAGMKVKVSGTMGKNHTLHILKMDED